MTTSRWVLPRRDTSVPTARAAVRGFLHAERPPVPADAAALVVSELVSNAVRHTGADSTVELTVETRSGAVRIEVLDHDPRPPLPAGTAPAVDDECGRGLVIVDQVSRQWGWFAVEGNGKTVWCDLDD
ncbi:MAG: ATP-binding protein [Acidimicrobiales bacterium]